MNNKKIKYRFFSSINALVLFILAHCFYISLIIAMTYLTKNISLMWFDLRMFQGYDLAYAETIVSELTSQNVLFYLTITFPLDFFYPVLVGLFFFVFFKLETKKWRYAIIGFGTMIFDLLENIIVAIMITQPLTPILVEFGSIATIIKGIYYVFAYGLTILLVVRKVFKLKK